MSDHIETVTTPGPAHLHRPWYVRRMAESLPDVPVYALALEHFREVRARYRLLNVVWRSFRTRRGAA